MLDLESRVLQQVTFNNTPDLGPDWSPDGGWIAFHAYEGGKYHIYVIRPDGTERRQVSPDDLGNAYFPTWSTDGSRIAFHVDEGGFFQIYLMGADGSDVRPLMEVSFDDKFPDWSPGGEVVVFQRAQEGVDGVYLYSLVDGSVGPLVSVLGDFLPDWEPQR
jgi:TolB protein